MITHAEFAESITEKDTSLKTNFKQVSNLAL